MSINLIELFNNTVSDVLVRQSSAMLDESSESTSSAVEKIFPALLNAILIKGNTDSGAKDLLDFMSANRIDEALHDDVPSLLAGGPETEKLTADGAGILKYLFGGKLSYMVDWISSGNGLKTSSASTLLKIIAPLVMGAIARAVKEKSLNASGLKDLLNSQKPFVDASGPAAISELLGVTHVPEPEKPVQSKLESDAQLHTGKQSSTMSKLLPWIVLLIAALGLFYFLQKGGAPAPVVMESRKDSLENVRKLDSIRSQTLIDSMGDVKKGDSLRNAMMADSLGASQRDSLE